MVAHLRNASALLLLLASLLAVSGPAAAEENAGEEPDDPRIALAGAMLDSKEDYPHAIELYEAVLAEHPEHAKARLWAARVHAWSGHYDESLAHFDRLLAGPEPPATAAIERAEVLSWGGRSGEAEAAFVALLAREPADARAWRGLARSYRWSNQLAKADRAYQKALELEEDAAVRAELEAMRVGPRWLVESESSYFADSDEFHRYRSEARAVRKLDYDTALRGELRYTQVDLDEHSDQRGWAGTLGLERRLPHKLRAALDVGGLEWSHGRDRFLGRAEIGWSAPTGSSLGLSLAHGDLLAYTSDVDVIQRGYASTALRASVWHPIREAWSAYVSAEIAFFSDENIRRAAGASLDYQPWKERDLHFSLGLDWAGYTRDPGTPNLYYSPDDDLSLGASARLTQPLVRSFEVWLRPSLGYGYAREDESKGESLNFGIKGGPRWRHASGTWLGMEGHYARTQRANGYNHHGAGLSIGREF